MHNIFIEKIYHEFEQNLLKVFGYSFEDLKTVLDRRDTPEREGHDLEEILRKAFEKGGVVELRQEMNETIACLEKVFMMERLGRKPTFDEWSNRVEELDFGMKKSDLYRFK